MPTERKTPTQTYSCSRRNVLITVKSSRINYEVKLGHDCTISPQNRERKVCSRVSAAPVQIPRVTKARLMIHPPVMVSDELERRHRSPVTVLLSLSLSLSLSL